MIKKIVTLFKIGRKLALSDALNIISKVYQVPISIKFFFSVLGLFGKKKLNQILMKRKDFVDQWNRWVLLLLNLDSF